MAEGTDYQSHRSKNSSLSEEAKGKRLIAELDGDEFIALLNFSCCDLLAYYKDNRKFKWFGDFDQLKKFVQKLGLQGEWSSPGGSAKKFSFDLVTLTWYSNKNSLLLQGKYGELLKDAHLNETQVRNSDPSIPMQNSPKSNLEKTLIAILRNTESALESMEKLRADWLSLKSNITILLQNSIDSNSSPEVKQNPSLPDE